MILRLRLGIRAITESHIYIDDDFEPIDIANRRVLDWVLYGKL